MSRVPIHNREGDNNLAISTRVTLAIITVLFMVPQPSHAQAQPKGEATPVNFSADDLAKWSIYSPLPAAERDQANEVSLNGEWELAEAKGAFSAATPDLSTLEWEARTAPGDGPVCVIPGWCGPESLVWRQLEEAAVDSRPRLVPAPQLSDSVELDRPTCPAEIRWHGLHRRRVAGSEVSRRP